MASKPDSEKGADYPVLQAASEVFRAHGYLGSSVQQLVEATGQSRSTLYGRFGDKAGLFVAALGWYVDHELARVGGNDVRTRIEAPLLLNTSRSAAVSSLPCLVARSCAEMADLPSEACQILTATLEQQWDAMTGNGDQSKGTLALAVRYGLATLMAAGVPVDILREAAEAY